MPSVMWKELTAEDLRAKAAANAIVVLPVASMEQHGPHLPVGVDTFLCEAVCRAGAELAVKDVPVVVAPTLWCGHGRASHGFRRHLHVRYSDLSGGAAGISQKHRAARLHQVFIVNGHGGNIAALNAFLPDLTRETGLTLYATTYFELSKADLKQFLEDQESVHHACEVETSMMMVVAPDTVKHDRLPEAYGMLNGDPRKAYPASRYLPFKDNLTATRRHRRCAPRQRQQGREAACTFAPKDSPRR